MPTKDPKKPDTEHVSISLLYGLFGGTANGRFSIACVFVLAMVVLIGRALGWW